jgi:hypothetical protein
MRRLFEGVARGVVAVAVVMVLAVPVEAKPSDRDWSGWSLPRFLTSVKRLVVKTLGDGVIIPRP